MSINAANFSLTISSWSSSDDSLHTPRSEESFESCSPSSITSIYEGSSSSSVLSAARFKEIRNCQSDGSLQPIRLSSKHWTLKNRLQGLFTEEMELALRGAYPGFSFKGFLEDTTSSRALSFNTGDGKKLVTHHLRIFDANQLENSPRASEGEWREIERQKDKVLKVLVLDSKEMYRLISIGEFSRDNHRLIGVVSEKFLESWVDPVKVICGRLTRYSEAFVKEMVEELERFYPGIAIEKELGEGTYSRVLSFTSSDGKERALKLSMKGEGSPVIYDLSKKKVGGEWFAFHKYRENVLKSYHAIAKDLKTGKVTVLSAEDVQSLIGQSKKRKSYTLIGTVSEYIKGAVSSDDWIEQNRENLTAETVHSLAMQLLSAAANFSEKGLIHRDIKPANILITPEGRLKLLDFGFVCKDLKGRGKLSQSGTEMMMAPEILKSKYYDGKVDSYSVAMTLKEWTKGIGKVDDRFQSLITDLSRENPKERLSVSEALRKYYLPEEVAASSSSKTHE